MLTWLDEFVLQHARNWEEIRKSSPDPLPKYKTPLDQIRVQVNLLARSPEPMLRKVVGQMSEVDRTYFESNYYQALAVHPVVNGGRALCVQPSVELTEDFWGAQAPDVSDWRSLVFQHDVVYLDFPTGVLALGDGFYVRAI